MPIEVDFTKSKYIDPWTYVYTFGIYKAQRYRDVLLIRPSYSMWCQENVDWFELSNLDLERALKCWLSPYWKRIWLIFLYKILDRWAGWQKSRTVKGS